MMEFQMKFFQSLYCPFITLHFDAQIVVENAMCIKCMGFFLVPLLVLLSINLIYVSQKNFFRSSWPTHTHTQHHFDFESNSLCLFFRKKHYANQFFKFHKKFFFLFLDLKLNWKSQTEKPKYIKTTRIIWYDIWFFFWFGLVWIIFEKKGICHLMIHLKFECNLFLIELENITSTHTHTHPNTV